MIKEKVLQMDSPFILGCVTENFKVEIGTHANGIMIAQACQLRGCLLPHLYAVLSFGMWQM